MNEYYYSKLLIKYSWSIIRETKLTLQLNPSPTKVEYYIECIKVLNNALDEWFEL